MSLQELIQTLKTNGIQLSLNPDGELSVRAPKGTLTLELKQRLQDNKKNILDLLKQETISQDFEQIIPDPNNLRRAYPISDLQSGFYMADNEFMEFHVRPHYYSEIDYDNFDLANYESAWNKMLSMHEGSIGVLTKDNMIEPLAELPYYFIPVHDLRGLNVAQRQQRLLSLRKKMERSQLPLDRWPWFDLQVSLWQEDGKTKGRVHYNNNNFFTDGCCTMRMVAQTKKFYENPSLQPTPFALKTADYVAAMQRLEASPMGQAARHYWESRLADLPPPPPVPQRPNMNRRVESHMQRRLITLAPALWQSFKNNAQRHGLTPSNAVTAVYAQVLSHWSNSAHFIMGHMVTRRFPMHEHIFDILGCFPSVYPLEVDWREQHDFLARAKKLQQQISNDVQQLSWGGMRVLQSLSSIKGGLGRSPCPFVTSSGLFLEFVENPVYGCLETSQALIDHQFWDLPDGTLVVAWDLLEEFFPDNLIDTMWKKYELLLNLLANDLESWTSSQFPLTPVEQLSIRHSLNQIDANPPIGLIHRKLAEHAQAIPHKTALITAERRFNYAELNECAHKIAARLHAAGAKPNQLIAILAEKGWEQIAGALGIVLAGSAYVPLSPSLPLARLEQILRDAGITKLVVQQEHIELANQLPADVFNAAEIVAEDAWPMPGAVEVTPDDLAYVIYTSGSTGKPKGVMIKHKAALNTLLDINERFAVTAEDVIFGISAFNFDLSVHDLFGAIELGACLVLPSAEDIHTPGRWAEVIQNEKVTVWNSTPAIVQLLVDYLALKKNNNERLRLVMMSGDWIPLSLPEQINQYIPQARVISLGGATEASIWSIFYPINSVEKHWQSIPYGYPLKNQSWHVLDSQMAPCPDYVVGQLYIGGVGLAEGYWLDEQKTNAAFIRHPQSGEKLYATGDIGCYHPNGCIEFLGRADFQVKIQGFRIELGEIETVLMEHPDVEEAVVVAKDDGAKGKRLVAYLVCQPSTLDTQPIRQYLHHKLPDYMVPSRLVSIPNIPLTSNGKVDRKSLMELREDETESQTTYLAPRNQIETDLVHIWENVLERSPIGVQDDFFALGGQSFAAIRIMTKIAEKFARNFSLGLILEGRTIEYLALAIQAIDVDQKPQPLVTIKKDGKYPPLFFVHPAGGNVLCYQGLAQQLDNSFYGFAAVGMKATEQPLRNIEEMASLYIESLKSVQAKGPYFIGGWSSGGMIAHAMAKQLEATGDLVEKVILIDTPAPTQYDAVAPITLLCWFLEDLNINFPLLELPMDKLLVSSEDSIFQDLQQHCDVSSYLPAGLDTATFESIFAVFRGIINGCRQYQPQAITSNCLLVRAAEGVVSEFADHPAAHNPDWGWKDLTRGHIKVVTAPGTHYTLLQPPQLQAVARVLKDYLQQDFTPQDEIRNEALEA